ncbi:hypothetical protein DPMN_104364 [Dreissena polymorpha]|uniref:Uncharacterized protein n=1 Tax=Dreissena polymorpha TaxID=45954 RepID=A0A9D4HA99_DREPO|nr:hypothetical protein DPMN_104364 [Dreissena polymorpha]
MANVNFLKIASSVGSHVFQHVFHENWAKNVTSRVFTCFHFHTYSENRPAPWWPGFFSPIWTIFELVQDINKTNVLTTFHDDWAKIVASRVLTRKSTQRTALPSFKLDRGIIGSNLLTKFHEDQTRNAVSRV